MELLVAIGIVVVLLAVLLPALAAARRNAQVTENRGHLQELSAAVENYRTLFDAYPGPVSEAEMEAGGNFTGAQNLLAALTRRVRSGGTAGFVQVTSGAWIEQDYSTGPEKDGHPLATPLVEPKPGDLMAGNVANGALVTVPLFVDHFASHLPVLYYRGTADAKVPVGMGPSKGVAGFYLSSNAALTSGTVHGADGAAYAQGLTLAGLQQDVTNADGTAKGQYVLISAGLDRVYGPNAAGKSDDIVQSGGH